MRKVTLVSTSLVLLLLVAAASWRPGPGPLEVLTASTYTEGGGGPAGSRFTPMTSWVSISFRGPEGMEVEGVLVDGVQHGDHSVRSLSDGSTLLNVQVEQRSPQAVLIYRWEGRRYSQELPLTDTGEHLYQ